MFKKIRADIKVVMERDPAARSSFEVFLTYSGIRALYLYRRAHWFWNRNCKLIARAISQRAKKKTGIEIHPAAKLGKGLFIDHGMGIVIGETTEIGENCVIYQGVTLGGTGKDTGKRHPTLQDNVMISAGATVLGPVIVGEGSKVGAGAVVINDVPPCSTVVGIPGRVVRMHGNKVEDMDQQLPDPVLEEFRRIHRRLKSIERTCGLQECSHSIASPKKDENLNCEVENCQVESCDECRQKSASNKELIAKELGEMKNDIEKLVGKE